LNNLGIRLSEVRDKRAALESTQESVNTYRRLAEAEPAAYLPDLAMALNNLGVYLSEVGDKRAALAPTQEAVNIRRRLAEAEPAAYLPDLAMALWGYAWVRVGEAAELAAALPAAQEAVKIYGQLCEVLPDAFTGYLRAATATQADVLEGLGRLAEATEIRDRLAASSSDDAASG
jgi:tetratricopeptide (TPR) repeat protein